MLKTMNRFVEINGGLGNQMFQYAYYMRLRSIFHDVRTFISSKLWEHDGGYELERVFGIKRHESLWEKLYHKGRPWTTLFHLLHRRYQGRNFKFQHADLQPDPKYGYFYGTWQSEKYFSDDNLIRSVFRFNPAFLSQQTHAVANCLRGGGN